MENRRLIPGVNDLETVMPQLAAEWNYKKNGSLTPRSVTTGTNRKVWWICSHGHEYMSALSQRKNGHGCPYCSGYRAIPGVNDLATTMPQIAAEWNYEKNGDLKPQDVKAGSAKKVWWKCSKGHEWETRIGSRKAGCNCPYCGNQKLLPGFNDLATRRPDIAAEWDYEKNDGLKPEGVMPSLRKKMWWKCGRGHEYYTAVLLRSEGYGCPYCSNHKVLPGFNDLATKAPDVVPSWNYEKNGDLTPQMVSSKSMTKVWWICEVGHEYEMVIHSRTEGKACPYCCGMKVLSGFNDLATKAPDVAASWNYEKNGNLTPQMVTARSTRKVWWKCEKNHEWSATVHDRYIHGCPQCFGLAPPRRHLVP